MSGDQLYLDAIVCNHRWDDGGEPVCERHGFLWPDGEDYCNGFDQSERALVAEVRRLRAWKAEALPVMAGLQELGGALGLPLGSRITGREAVDAALDLHNEARRAR